jgi:hypothetical protein
MNITDIAAPENLNFAGIDIIDVPDFLELVLRFLLNTSVVLVLVRWLYYPTARRKDYLFTFLLLSSLIFLLCYLLESVKLQIGFALGLFAIFGILRYRTDSIPIKEMTYLFMVIGISVINALTSTKTSLVDLLFTNAVLIFITYGMEKLWLLKHESSKTIIYEKIDLIRPENYQRLITDLRERTGIIHISRVEAEKIDFLREICTLTVYYESKGPVTSNDFRSSGNRDADDDD